MMSNNSSNIDDHILFNSSLLSVIILDDLGVILDINNPLLSTLGFGRNALLNASIDTLLTGETSFNLIQTKYPEGVLGIISIHGKNCFFNYHYQKCLKSGNGYLSLRLLENLGHPGIKRDELFRHTFHLSKTGLCLADESYKIMEINSAYSEFTSFSASRLTGHNLLENEPFTWMPEEQKKALREALQKIGQAENFEFPIRLKNGQSVTIQLSVEALEVNGHAYWLTSVTEQKLTEDHLLQSGRQQDLFFQNAPTGFFFMMLDVPIVWNSEANKDEILEHVFAHQRITRANQAILEQYGATEEEFIGLTPNDFFAHDLQHGKALWKEFFDRGQLQVDTYERRMDGSPFWVKGEYKVLYDEQKRIIGHFGIQNDITAQKLALHKAQEAFRRLEWATQSASLGIFSWDVFSNVVECNPVMYQLFGLRPAEPLIAFEDWAAYIHPKDAPGFLKKVDFAIRTESTFEDTFRIVLPDQHIRYLEVHATATEDEQANLKSLVGICRDVTRQVISQQRTDQASMAAQEDERTRISLKLKESLRLLTKAMIYLDQTRLAELPSSSLDKSHKIIQRIVDQIRQLTLHLKPDFQESGSIEEQIRELLHSFALDHPYQIDYRHQTDPTVKISDELRLHLYRILQDQLQYMGKNTKSDKIKVYLSVSKEKIRLITGHGIGPDHPKNGKEPSLKNLYKRVEILQGEVKVVRVTGKGCKTTISIPLK